jgi:hypothetical protein
MFALIRALQSPSKLPCQSLANIYWAGPVVVNDEDSYYSTYSVNHGTVGSYDSHDSPVTDWRVSEMDEY